MKRMFFMGIITAAALAASSVVPGYAGAGTASNGGAAVLLESVRQNYMASQRLNALKAKNTRPEAAKAEAPSSWLTRVNTNEVNMASNRFEKKAQKAVNIGGRTYYASNDMAAASISRNQSARFAVDPISGKKIDKAEAVIFADASGRVIYFESEATGNNFISLAEQKFAGKSPVIQ